MLGLPAATECKEQIAKSLLFKTLDLQHGDRGKLEGAIHRLMVVNLLHPKTLNIAPGKTVKSIYVLKVELSSQDYDRGVVALLPHYIKQHLILALSWEDRVRLAVLHKGKYYEWLLWKQEENTKLELSGTTLDVVWDNFVRQIGNFDGGSGNVDGDIRKKQLEEEIKKLQKQIANAKNKAPLFAKLQGKKKELEGLGNE